jgi:hypothetical protein
MLGRIPTGCRDKTDIAGSGPVRAIGKQSQGMITNIVKLLLYFMLSKRFYFLSP